MDQLISAADFRERFDISDDIDSRRITPAIGAASRRLRKWVGDTVYASALTENFEELQADLKNAEAHLTYHFAILGMNYPLSSKGIVATNMASEGREMRKYLTPVETDQVATQFLEKAREIAEPYLLHDGTPTSSFEVVTDEFGCMEAATRSHVC